jgi:hypothetical protein
MPMYIQPRQHKLKKSHKTQIQILSIDQSITKIKRGKTNRQVNINELPKIDYIRYKVMIILQQSAIIQITNFSSPYKNFYNIIKPPGVRVFPKLCLGFTLK